LLKRAQAARPDAFVEVITLRRQDYDELRDRLQPLPGTVFREGELPLAPTAGFARALLGGVGPATAEIVQASQGRIRAGDVTGLSGLQQELDARLSGKAGYRVATAPDPAGPSPSQREAVTLVEEAPVDGEPVRLTLDQRVQDAADAALTAAAKPAGLVAVRVSTGEVLAVANGGPGATGYNRAMLGRYPPGSTFKVVSAFALLEQGLTPDDPVGCPPTRTVNGKVFTNAEGEVLGTVPFHTDFADSCNTAFVSLADRVTSAQLADAASALGYGRDEALGTSAFLGGVPQTADAVEHAADMIGQGKILASPLTVASVTASVAAGAQRPPRLVRDPAPEPPAPAAEPLAAGTSGAVRTMMREVVTSGTGTALRSVAGGPVSGKTGTAEYGSDVPPATHAWFTGFQGDLAFAVVVEGGGFGAEAAAPLAVDFLTALAG
jgi:cell division protein FtsI/penicillin-binding protein 2